LKKLERDGTVIETYFTPSTNPEEFRNGYYYTEEWDGSNTIIHKRDATTGNLEWTYPQRPRYNLKADKNNNVYFDTSDDDLYKLDPDGNLEWVFTESFNYFSDYFWDFCIDKDGFVYAGNSTSLFKISPTGDEVWESYLAGDAWTVDVDGDGNTYVGHNDRTVIKLDPNGDEIWESAALGAQLEQIAVSRDGSFICVTSTSGGWVKGLDGDGVEVWNQNHGQANANLSGWVIMAPDGHAYYQATYNSNPDGSVRRIDIDNNNTSLPGVPYIFNIGNS